MIGMANICFREYFEKYKTIFLLILLIIYTLIVRILFINQPFIGKHAWNEAVYSSVVLDMVKHHRIYPIYVYFYLPDFNLGPIWFWCSFVSVKIFGSFEWAFRLPSVLATLVIVITIYFIVLKISYNVFVSFFSGVIFSSMPVTLYYGARAQPEALMYMFFYISLYFFLLFFCNKKKIYLILSALLFSFSFITKSSILPFLFFFLIFLILFSNRSLSYISIYLLFFLSPIILWQLVINYIYYDYKPYLFFLSRVFLGTYKIHIVNSKFATGINLFKMFFQVFGVFSLTSLFYFFIFYNKFNYSKFFMSFLFLIGLFSIFYINGHAVTHEYYSYLIAFPVAYYSSEVFNYFLCMISFKESMISFKERGFYLAAIIILLSFLSFYYAHRYWTSSDAHGNIWNVKVGKIIKKIVTDDDSFILVFGPVMGYYSEHPFHFWEGIYKFHPERLKSLTIKDVLAGKRIMEYHSVYRENFLSFLEFLKKQKYKIIVINSVQLHDVAVRTKTDFKKIYTYLFNYLVEENYREIFKIGSYVVYKKRN